MDDARFDSLTRMLAAGHSRRQGLRVLRRSRSRAPRLGEACESPRLGPSASLGPGDPCRDSSQCVAADAPLICADNGFALDGPLNCCTYVGSRCGFDSGMLWRRRLYRRILRQHPGLRWARGPLPGQLCLRRRGCSPHLRFRGCHRRLPLLHHEGSRCNSDAACCGAATCYKAFAPTWRSMRGTTLLARDPCQYGYQCVAADTALTCDYIGQTDDFRCCAHEAVAAAGTADAAAGCAAAMTASALACPHPVVMAKGASATSTIRTRALLAWSAARQSGFICATWADCGG